MAVIPSSTELLIILPFIFMNLLPWVLFVIVAVLAIRFLLGYIKQHDFKMFGWYRIVLGGLILAYALLEWLVFAPPAA